MISYGLLWECDLVPVRRIMAGLGVDYIWHSLVYNYCWNTDWAAMLQVYCSRLFPFGKEVQYGGNVMSTLANIVWLIISGIPLAITAVINGILLCCTIIGIPFGMECFKIAKLALMPFGATVIDI